MLPAPHYICMYRLLPTTPPSPSRHYYLRLIAGTNLPIPKVCIAWWARAQCTHITFAQLNPKTPEGNKPRLLCPRPTRYRWTDHAVRKGPRNKSLNVWVDRGIEPQTISTNGQWPNHWTTQASNVICKTVQRMTRSIPEFSLPTSGFVSCFFLLPDYC